MKGINKKGFTLTELMVVVGIIILLAGILLPNLARRIDRAKMARVEAEIAALETAISMYEHDMGGYFGDVNGDISVVETALTQDQGGNWSGPYIKGIGNDPWGNPYRFFGGANRKNNLSNETGIPITDIPDLDYYIYSKGKDRDTGNSSTNKDDINNWDVNKSWEQYY